MIDALIALCTTEPGLLWLFRLADALIALAYFSIPVSMLWVLRRRNEDLPFPSLWVSFVLFIFACGGTHALHVVAAGMEGIWLPVRTGLQLLTAAVSIVTAVALNLALPKIAQLPSPRQQRAALEAAVTEATRDKTALLLEINHRVGNQLAKMGAMVRIEMRRADPAGLPALQRIQDLLEELGAEHHALSSADYRQHKPAGNFYDVEPEGSAGSAERG